MTFITTIIKIYIKFYNSDIISTAELTLGVLQYDIKLVFTLSNVAVKMITFWVNSVNSERKT